MIGKRALAAVLACVWTLAGMEALPADHSPCILLDESYGALLAATTPEVAVWTASSGWKVSRTRALPRARVQAAAIALAANETEALQIVVQPARALSGFIAAAGALTGPDGAQIAAKNVEVLRVRYVNIERISDASSMKGPWPDPLPPFKAPIAIAANENQPLWVRVHAPKGTPAGVYKGDVLLTADGYRAEVPIQVEVFDFELPDKKTCVSAFGFSPGTVYQYQKLTAPEDQRAVLAKYWESLSAHHISPYNPTSDVGPKVEWVRLGPDEGAELSPADRALAQEHPLTPVIDWTDWDAEIKRMFDSYHFQTFRLGMPGIGGGDFQGFQDGTRERDLAFARYAHAVQEHLRETGLLDAAYVYWIDEPTTKDYPYVMAGFQRLKEAAPDIRRMLTEQPEPELRGGPTLWCPLTLFYKHENSISFRAAGDRFWWYVCTIPKRPYCGLFTDHPATDLRVWLWQTWQYDFEGILIWQSNLWTTECAYPDSLQNPYEDPMSWMSGYGTKPGEKKPWGNGDGRFMYPPEAAADGNPPGPVLDGPVDSIRWEMLRDGIEDYEYLAILKRTIAAKRGTAPKRMLRRAEKLLEVPPEITSDLRTYTKDPAPVEARRKEIAQTIERLSRF